jgi:hypothetical protein
MILMQRKIIYGCESRGDALSPYLTRVTLISCGLFAVYLHIFHRSDSTDRHDHPWNFITCILWRGYIEETPSNRRRLWPGMTQYRPAKWIHRVELVEGKRAVTLVFRGPYVREWGFYVNAGWQRWLEYFKERGC